MNEQTFQIPKEFLTPDVEIVSDNSSLKEVNDIYNDITSPEVIVAVSEIAKLGLEITNARNATRSDFGLAA